MLTRRRIVIAAFVLLLSSSAVAAQTGSTSPRAAVPKPRESLGFDPGEDRKLADWSQIVEYFKRLDSASPRVSVHQAGLTTERRPFIYAIISSEENIKNLSRIRESQRKLADPRLIANIEERGRLIRETPAVVAITCSIHSTEIVASQMSMELAYRLAADDSRETAEILRNTILILVPSVNPDGIDIVTNWYRKTLGTKFEGSSPPVLYHHYAGHDNNRDWFMLTQVETQMVSSLFWREWFPELVYDVHQQGQFGSRMCVPPFFDPQNPNIDPVILREVGSIGMRMATRLDAAGFKGIVTNSTYDTWWHGGLRTAPYYHNAVGILTEAASAKIATPIDITREQLRSPTRGLPNPLVAQTNFPDPWEGGRWSMRDIVNLELVTTRTALEEAALHREELIGNFVGAATRAIEAGRKDAPFAYIVPKSQDDRLAAEKMIDILVRQGVQVHRAKSQFTVEGETYGVGSFVILMSQPYRANVKCLFEAQKYPDRRLHPNGPAEPPYDVAGWTLPMQMGVHYAEARNKFESNLEAIDQEDAEYKTFGPGGVDGDALEAHRALKPNMRFISPGASIDSFRFITELFGKLRKLSVGDQRRRASVILRRLDQAFKINGRTYPPGSIVVEYNAPKGLRLSPRFSFDHSVLRLDYAGCAIPTPYDIAQIANDNHVALDLLDDRLTSGPQINLELSQPRAALYRSWVPSMDEGWTRWVLEQFGFEYATITDADVRTGGLRDKFDVVILPDQSVQQIINGNRAGSYPEEFCGGITEAGVANLRSFVEAGGVLICLDSASELAVRKFDLPVKNVLEGLKRDLFYAPGSIFRAKVDNQNPIGYGMPAEADLYFVSATRRGRSSDPDAGAPPDAAPRAEHQGSATAASPGGGPLSQTSRRDDASTLVSAIAFEITDSRRARSVARYVEGNPLRSGWLLGPQYLAGKSALVDVSLGKGRVVLFGFRTQHRGQTWGTFKFLFNAILLGGMK